MSSAAALNNSGVALHGATRLEEALSCFDRAIALDPAYAMAHCNRAAVLLDMRRPEAALRACEAALALNPRYAAAHYNRGNALRNLDRPAAAIESYDRALALRPDLAMAHNNRGTVLRDLDRPAEALASLDAALALDPAYARAHYNRGSVLEDQGRSAEAVASYDRAIALRPDYADAHASRATTLLAAGRLAEGWEDHEWRWRGTLRSTPPRPFRHALWDGRPVERGAVLLWGEQGVGDVILHAGLIPEALARMRRGILECDRRLVGLLGRSFPGLEVVPARDPPDGRTAAADIAWQSPLGSLPRWFRRGVADFPARRAYLLADRTRAESLRARYRAGSGGLCVGIAWRSRNLSIGRAKTTALSDWAPILRTPGVTFVNLQYGDCAAELAETAAALGVTVRHDETIDPLADLDGFAAQVAAMDLVISVSNTTVHVAGALGKPAWVLLPGGRGLLWYWFRDREDSPWYPSLRLFRQPAAGDWAPVVARIAAALAAATAAGHSSWPPPPAML